MNCDHCGRPMVLEEAATSRYYLACGYCPELGPVRDSPDEAVLGYHAMLHRRQLRLERYENSVTLKTIAGEINDL